MFNIIDAEGTNNVLNKTKVACHACKYRRLVLDGLIGTFVVCVIRRGNFVRFGDFFNGAKSFGRPGVYIVPVVSVGKKAPNHLAGRHKFVTEICYFHSVIRKKKSQIICLTGNLYFETTVFGDDINCFFFNICYENSLFFTV